MKLYACIDESGDTGYSKKSSRYFVLCAVITDNLDVLRRLARDIHRKKDKKKKNILHAYAETDELRNLFAKKLQKIDFIESVACVIDKQKIKNVDVYLYATGEIAKYFKDKEIETVVVAKRDTRKSYNQRILATYQSYGIEATFSDPSKDKSLQVADFYSWSVYSFFEKESATYFDKLGSHIQLL